MPADHTHSDHDWLAHADAMLMQRGGRTSGARTQVVQALAAQDCCASAQEIHDRIRRAGGTIGIASVYRTLDQLHSHGLILRVDTGDGIARFEPVHADGHHHHHLVCTRCGTVEAFHDDALEHAIHAIADRVDFEVTGHDVALRGTCRTCRTATKK